MTTPLIEMRNISKAFPGVQALKDVSLAAYGGEVHMLVGQNGAGKSTLIKILCGAYHPDHGDFLLNGKPVRIESTRDARRLGIAVIFQEFSLVPYLDIAQNIFLGREFPGRIPGTIDRCKTPHRSASNSRSAGDGYRHPYQSASTGCCAAANGGDSQGALAERQGSGDG